MKTKAAVVLVALGGHIGNAAANTPAPAPFTAALPSEVTKYLDDSYHGERPAGVEQIDLNGDGKPDLVLDMACTHTAGECKKVVFENQGATYRLAGDALICDDKPDWKPVKIAGSAWLGIACATSVKSPWSFDATSHAYGYAPAAVVAPVVAKALALYSVGKYLPAAKAFDKAHDQTQLTDEQLYLRCLAWAKAGERTKALELLKFEGGGDPRKDLTMGDLAWEGGDKATAVYSYKEYLKKAQGETEEVARAKRRVAGEESPPSRKH